MIINKHYLQSPVQVIETQLGTPKDYLQQCIEETYKLGDSMNQSTNVKGIMSSWKVWEETKIFDKLLSSIVKFCKDLDYLQDDRSKIKLTYAWSAIYKKGHYTIAHTHMPSDLSFVYYLKSNGATPLIFNGCDFSISPINDTLIVFPAYLIHEVPTHEDEEDRICISGNFMYGLE